FISSINNIGESLLAVWAVRLLGYGLPFVTCLASPLKRVLGPQVHIKSIPDLRVKVGNDRLSDLLPRHTSFRSQDYGCLGLYRRDITKRS
ncbi:MAG: hypothetical protein QF654_09575, partial [Alphaproteobacteria bacterium]|nr:hypothetical protein [Alphaproteobacteria bacterium]